MLRRLPPKARFSDQHGKASYDRIADCHAVLLIGKLKAVVKDAGSGIAIHQSGFYGRFVYPV
jgi:hypothetical protein